MFSQKKGSSYVKEQSKNISKAHKKKKRHKYIQF